MVFFLFRLTKLLKLKLPFSLFSVFLFCFFIHENLT